MSQEAAILILARGGSKGVPRKNARKLDGKPLINWVLEEANELELPMHVSTEDAEIVNIVEDGGLAFTIHRPRELAEDNSKSIDAVKHALNEIEKEIIVLVNACAPFIKWHDIQNCIDIYENENCDSVVSLVEDFSAHPSKMCEIENGLVKPLYDVFETGERQNLKEVYKRNTAIYVFGRDLALEKNKIIGSNVCGYVMPPERSLDINTPYDFEIAELYAKYLLDG